MPGVSESVAMYKEEITQQIYELISEAEKVRYKISNPELKILNIEENRAEYLFAADWEPVRTVENDPFMKGMRQAAEKLSDDKEKAYAEQIVHEWLVEMQDWQKTERLEEPVVVMMDSADSWTVYYPYMENREETLIPLAEYIKENWTEDSEARYQSGVNLINEEIGRFRGE